MYFVNKRIDVIFKLYLLGINNAKRKKRRKKKNCFFTYVKWTVLNFPVRLPGPESLQKKKKRAAGKSVGCSVQILLTQTTGLKVDRKGRAVEASPTPVEGVLTIGTCFLPGGRILQLIGCWLPPLLPRRPVERERARGTRNELVPAFAGPKARKNNRELKNLSCREDSVIDCSCL